MCPTVCERAGELYFHMERLGHLSTRMARFYAAECALALGYLHSIEVVYRDLKPENIMVDKFGHIRLVDFGLSKLARRLEKRRMSTNICHDICLDRLPEKVREKKNVT